MIKIDKIGVAKVVVEGTRPRSAQGDRALRQAPRCRAARERGDRGAPHDLRLAVRRPGPAGVADTISVRTLTGTWDYVLTDYPVRSAEPDRGVEPTTDPTPGQPLATLTLTTCWPGDQARQRLIVKRSSHEPPNAAAGTGSDEARARHQPVRRERVADPGLRQGSALRRSSVGCGGLLFHRYPRLDHLVRRLDPVRRRAVRLLHGPRAASCPTTTE